MSLLIQSLLKENLITQEQLNDAKDKQLGAKKPLQEVLVEMGFIKEEDLVRISSKIFKLPVLDTERETVDSSCAKLIPYEKAKQYGVFPVRKDADTLVLAMSDPNDIFVQDDIKIITNLKIQPLLSKKSQIRQYQEKYYHSVDEIYDLVKNIPAVFGAEAGKRDGLEEISINIEAL